MQPSDKLSAAQGQYDTGFTSQIDTGVASSLQEPRETLSTIQQTIKQHIGECIEECKAVTQECVACVNAAIVNQIAQSATFLQSLGSDLQDAIINLLGTAYGYASTVGISMPPAYTIPPKQVFDEVQQYARSQPSTVPTTTQVGSTTAPRPTTPPGGYYSTPPPLQGTGSPPGTVPPSLPPYQTIPPSTVAFPQPPAPPYMPPGSSVPPFASQPPSQLGGGNPPLVPPGSGSTPPGFPTLSPPYQSSLSQPPFPTTQVGHGQPITAAPSIPGGGVAAVPYPGIPAPSIPFVGVEPTGGIPVYAPQYAGGGVYPGGGSIVNCPPSEVTCPAPQVSFQCPVPVINVYVEPSGRTTMDVPPIGGGPAGPRPGEIGCPDRNEHEWIDQDCSIAFRQEMIEVMGDIATQIDEAQTLKKYVEMTQPEEEDFEWVQLAGWRRNSPLPL